MNGTRAFLDEAHAIGDRLVDAALWAQNRCTWQTAYREPSPQGGSQATTLGPTLYDGTAGVALFLARLAELTLDRRFRTTAVAAARHAMRHRGRLPWSPTPSKARHLREVRFGVYFGSLGIAWSAIEVARLTEDEALNRMARRQLRELVTRRVGGCDFDIISGSAGAIPVLLRLENDDLPGAAETAELLGRRLVAAGHPSDRGVSWHFSGPPSYPRNLTGFSHGTSGIAWALSLLYQSTGRSAFAEAAAGAFEYERRQFDPIERNWPDFRQKRRSDGRFPCMVAWCHGAPGIGLARVLAYPILRDRRLVAEAQVARATTRRGLERDLELPGRDFKQCCGVSGVAECLWLIEDALGEEGALARARMVGRYGLERFGQRARRRIPGWVEWPNGQPKGVYPALMTGLAGVGNFLLRLAHPRTMPSALVPGASGS